MQPMMECAMKSNTIRSSIANTLSAVFAFLVATLIAGSAFAVDGTNLPGSDYTNFPAHKVQVCKNTCAGESRCQAYSWVKPGIQGQGGVCWLKHAEPEIVKDPCCDSFTRRLMTKADVRAEDKTNRPGLDYKNFKINSWQDCEATCNAEGRCSSWTYVRRGVQGPTGVCWLKSKVARPVRDENTVSGVKYVRPSVRFD